MLHLLEIVIFAVTKACWAVSLVAIDAEVAILVVVDHSLAPEALDSHILLVLSDHALIVLTTAISVLLHALVLGTETKTLLLTSV